MGFCIDSESDVTKVLFVLCLVCFILCFGVLLSVGYFSTIISTPTCTVHFDWDPLYTLPGVHRYELLVCLVVPSPPRNRVSLRSY